MGNERKNYMQAFIVKFNHLKFKSLPPEEALNLKAILPGIYFFFICSYFVIAFLQNEELNKIAENYIQKNKQNTKKIFTVMRKEKLWIEEIIPKIIHEIRTTKSIALFDNLLEYLSEAGIYYKDFETIIKLVQELGLSFAEMSNDAKVNMLTYFYIQQIQANANDSKNLKIYSENQQAFLKQLCKSLLRSEYFHFFENVVVHDGKVVKIKYYGSFELGQDLMSNTFKVFPKNKMGTIEEFDSSHSSENDLFITQTGASEENLFETSKAFEEQTIRSDYKKITRQFMLYNQYHEHAELPPENEQLEQEFIDLQNKNFNLVKFKENFANFLIDITLILHEFGLLYKTNLECEQSKILVDIALVDQKTAIIFVDQQETIYELQNDGRIYHPDNFNKMKIDTLRKKGWNVIPVIYESWNNEFDTKEKKEYYIKKKIDAFGKANI